MTSPEELSRSASVVAIPGLHRGGNGRKRSVILGVTSPLAFLVTTANVRRTESNASAHRRDRFVSEEWRAAVTGLVVRGVRLPPATARHRSESFVARFIPLSLPAALRRCQPYTLPAVARRRRRRPSLSPRVMTTCAVNYVDPRLWSVLLPSLPNPGHWTRLLWRRRCRIRRGRRTSKERQSGRRQTARIRYTIYAGAVACRADKVCFVRRRVVLGP